MSENTPTNGKAIASLVLGILAAVCVFFGYGALLGIVLGVIGLVLGISAKKETPSGMATAGIVLSSVKYYFHCYMRDRLYRMRGVHRRPCGTGNLELTGAFCKQ